MPHVFLRHVERANQHLVHAIHQLEGKQLDEGLVDVRCVLSEICAASKRPVGWAEREVLGEIAAAAIRTELLLREALRQLGESSPPQ